METINYKWLILIVAIIVVVSISGCTGHADASISIGNKQEEKAVSEPPSVLLSSDGWSTDIKAGSYSAIIPVENVEATQLPNLCLSLRNGGVVSMSNVKIFLTDKKDTFGKRIYVMESENNIGQFGIVIKRVDSKTGVAKSTFNLGEWNGYEEISEDNIKPSYGEDVLIIVSGIY